MKVTIIRGENAKDSENYIACTAILKDNMIHSEEVIDTLRMMKTTGGRFHPQHGFAIIPPDGSPPVWDYFGLIKWIDQKGYKLL